MDRGKRKGNFLGITNNKIYMDLNGIIREHALAYLPAKSLMRFKSVCRDWKLQISSPFFVHNQSQCFRSVGGLFCQVSGKQPVLVPFDGKSCGVPDPVLSFMPEPVLIRSSSNGLLCCQSSSPDKAYYICNPVNKQWKKLPPTSADHGSNPSIALVFEPSLLNFVPEYKLVCAFRSNDFPDAIEFEVYNSRENAWKTSAAILFMNETPVPGSGVCVNNIIYWKLASGSVLAFDLVNDTSNRLGYYHTQAVGNVNGNVCLATVHGSSLSLNVLNNSQAISAMPMYPRTKMCTSAVYKGITGDANHRVVFVSSKLVVLEGYDKLCLFDLGEKNLKELINNLGSGGKRTYVPYVNSLVSI
ncbi:OLC1v1018807C1 [Oldenlandia corymbosa var. corymbosa]|uniref:OLC1v1018807C1 n=1 Tax=Oldenlandia corymbosa var. corymbosa TaxID=529605 RepID=A0AAV1ECM7_OLDCO|nr:OLC1v1018807C1 [Oldenlandia corymbosa var. corymbosa]